MAKTKEELNELKQEYELLKSKLNELSEEELKQITGGCDDWDDSDIEAKYITD